MPAPRTIPTSQVTDAVTYKLFVDGEQIPASIPVRSILVQREINKIPLARIRMIDGNPALEDFLVSNEEYFIPGKEIEIRLGYRSDDVMLFKGIVVSHSNRIMPRSSELVVECRDKAVKLTVGKKSKHYENITDGDVAEQIIDRYGLDKDIEPTPITHKELVQFHTTDWDFIISRMDVIGRICLVEDGKISTRKPDLTSSPVLDVLYGATILEFNAEVDARTQFSEIKSKAWDYTSQTVSEDTGDEPEMHPTGNLSPENLAEVIGLDSHLLIHSGRLTNEQVKEWSNAKMLRTRLAKVRGSVKFQGFPDVKPGSIISLNGVGNRFNGPVFVCSVKHDYSNGNWITDVNFGMPESWFAETINPFHLSSQLGFMPAVQGLQIGIVTDLEDPEGEHRIKVRFPIISSDEEGVWMRIATLDAGKNRGTFFRPEKDDEVIVGFIFNDTNSPVVLGMLHSSTLAAPFTASNDNHEKGYVSRSDIRMIFNDDENSYSLQTPGGKTVILNDSKGIVQIEDEHGNKIKFESSGVTVESASVMKIKAATSISIEAPNINVSASSQFSVSASGCQMKAGRGNATIKAPVVKVEGSGMTTIKGGIVKIN